MSAIYGNTQNQFTGYNNTGGTLAKEKLISLTSWQTNFSLPNVSLAVANGTNKRADGMLVQRCSTRAPATSPGTTSWRA